MFDPKFDSKDVEQNKMISVLAYLWILFLVPLLLARKSKFAQAHAKQGLVLFVVQSISSLFAWVPIIGPLWNVIIFFLIPLYALVRVLMGTYWPIPKIHSLAQRIHFD